MALPASWINDDVGLHRWTLPKGWESRRVQVGIYGSLHVFAIGRLDLITMKFLANRAVDLDHLLQLKPTSDELDQVLN